MNLPLRDYFQLMAAYLRPQQRSVLMLALLLLTQIGLQLINPQIVRYFIDTALAGGELSILIRAASLFLGIAIVGQVLAVVATYVSEIVAWTATNALRVTLVDHCLGLDLSFHKTRTSGELIERIDGDVNTLSNFFSRFVIQIVGNMLLLLGILVLLWREDWRVGLGMTLFAMIGLFFLVRIRTLAVPFWTKNREITARFYGFLSEHLGATEDLRANGAVGYVMDRFHDLHRRWLPVHMRAEMAGYSMWISNAGVFAIGLMVALAVSTYLWRLDAISIGTVYLIFHYTNLLQAPINQIRTQLTDLQQAEAGIRRIQELLETKSLLMDGELVDDGLVANMDKDIQADVHTTVQGGPLSVEFRNVGFSYEDQPDEQVLDDISFRLEPGQVLGLLGRTGSGKSTLARLLLRLYDPTDGQITIGGVTPDALPLRTYRQLIGMVTQDVQLFQASVRDNITFFNPTIPDARIIEVLTDLDMGAWLQSLPNGLDTELSAGGGGLSAGQAQLLAFARVFVDDPGLVLLDEASSRLDPATEQTIEGAVDTLLDQRTGILIAHRLATVQRADKILILEQGRIVEYGDRVALSQDPDSRFAHLLAAGMFETGVETGVEAGSETESEVIA
ncbi:MAG: ABC transporter ATP-binding protein [Chloroflexota bacterium]